MIEVVTDEDGWSIVYDWNEVDLDGPHWTEVRTDHMSDYIGRAFPNDLYPLCWTLLPGMDWRYPVPKSEEYVK